MQQQTTPERNGLVAGDVKLDVQVADLPQDVADNTIFDWVELDKIFVPPYGRGLSQRKVAGIRAHWNIRAVGVLYLSMREDGTFAALDGHHRIKAAEQENVRKLPARVYIDLTYEEEAELYWRFATVNQQSAMDKFRARIEARDPDALAIQHAVEVYAGMHVGTYWSRTSTDREAGLIQAVSALEKVYQQHGPEGLEQTLQLLRTAWGNSSRAWSSTMLTGFSRFWARYHNHPYLDRQRLVDTMRLLTPETLLGEAAKQRGFLKASDGSSAVGRVLLLRYNVGLRAKKLPEWAEQAYGIKTRKDAAERASVSALSNFAGQLEAVRNGTAARDQHGNFAKRRKLTPDEEKLF